MKPKLIQEGDVVGAYMELNRQALALQARMDSLRSGEAHRERKDDTRRKIILGGCFLAMILDGDEPLAAVLLKAANEGIVSVRDRALVREVIDIAESKPARN